MWDIDAAIKEATWAREHGLRAVNFPVEAGPVTELKRSRFAGLHYYNDPIWEPFWAACEDLGMPLVSHGGAGDPNDLPGGMPVWINESREIARRPMHRLIFAGVFERHPDLKLVLTELPGDWWRVKLADMDSLGMYGGGADGMKPSEYAKRNVFLGASFQARFEAEDAIEHDYWQNIIWGTDYPHVEGTWRRPGDGETAEPAVAAVHLPRQADRQGAAHDRPQRRAGLRARRRRAPQGRTAHQRPDRRRGADPDRRDPRRPRHVGLPPVRRLRLKVSPRAVSETQYAEW